MPFLTFILPKPMSDFYLNIFTSPWYHI